MKVTIEQIKNAYETTKLLSFTGMEVSEINKVMNARSAMRPHYDAFKAFDEDVRNAHKPSEDDWNFLVEVEKKGLKNASPEEQIRHNELAIPYIAAINEALAPKLAEEVEINVEKISKASVAVLLANNKPNLDTLEDLLTFLMP
jgi:hypothetical protein